MTRAASYSVSWHERYPVTVSGYEGAYFVEALESDPIGYFLSAKRAKEYARGNWDDLE